MTVKSYHLWNPFTVMDEFLKIKDFGPVTIVRGEGPYVFNARGARFINGFSSLWNVAIGHGREELIEAASQQMRELAYASCFRQTHPRAIELAAKLVGITNGRYQHVYLGTNGSEAVETALKMARQYHRQSPDSADHQRHKIISLRHCYHGVSYGVTSTSGLDSDNEKFGPLLPGFVQIEPPYCYRCPYGKDGYPECGLVCAHALGEMIEAEGPQSVAAFIMEPILGAYGVIVPPEEYYEVVGRICRKYGALLIADEVTTGFGRTGKLFVSEDWDPSPDILCLAKAISSGYLPLAATLATESVYERFLGDGNQFEHGSTASGHPVCAAVGLKNIELLIGEKLPENAAEVGAHLLGCLQELAEKRDQIGDVRGRGLMIGIELVKDPRTREPLSEKESFNVVLDLATLGLLVYSRRNIVGLLPPLIIDKAIADEMVAAIDRALDTGMKANIARKARLAKEFAASKFG
ncbi:aspartate aminotransferase family protein [Candidatus Bipolaricaulota bacterium]